MAALYSMDRRKEIGELYFVLQDHTYAKDNVETTAFICMTCKETFQTKDSLKQHAESHGNTDEDSTDHAEPEKTVDKRKEGSEKVAKKNQGSEKKAKCSDCEMSFASERALKQHQTHKHTNKQYKCQKCSKSFKSNRHLKLHAVSVHNTFQPHQIKFKCDTCEASFPQKVLLIKHIQMHKGILKHKCEECQRGFKLLADLMRHQVNAHGKKVQVSKKKGTIKCPKCPTYVFTEPGLKYHNTTMHIKPLMPPEEKGKRPCPFRHCSELSNNLQELKAHIKSHTVNFEFQCNLCDRKFFNAASLTNHKRFTHNIHFKCDVCDEKFKKGSDHRKHIKMHKINSLFECNICEQKFRKIKDLSYHKSYSHQVKNELHITSTEMPRHAEESSLCFECGTSFLNHQELKKHEELDHSISENCSQCEKVFNTRRTLDLHIKAVHRVRDQICSDCGASFTTARYLKLHKRIHNKDNVCSYCARRFTKRGDLQAHEYTHTNKEDLTCTICNKVYTTRYFKQHMKMHQGDGGYKCSHCGKLFGSAQGLHYHRKVKKCVKLP